VDVPFKTSPDLAAARLTGGQDFVFWDGPVLDMDGHGTHVASTIGEDTNNTLAEAGIAYNATIMPLKACLSYWDVQFTISALGVPGFAPADAGGCPVSAVAEAIRYAADAGAAVINMSLGGPDQSIAIRDAMDYAVGKGTFIAVAMGNEYEEGNPVDYPAADAGEIKGAVAVTAVGRSLARAYYSNTGPHAEVAAPGGDYRQAGIPGLIWQVTIRPDDHEPSTVVFPRFDRYAEVPEQGTSMATPHVAGAAALLYSQGVTNPAVIEALLEATARDLGAAGRDEEYGFGLLQVRNALFGLGLSR
jgi:serine protease